MLYSTMRKKIDNGYMVDENGNVFNPRGKKLKPFIHSKRTKIGYLQVDLQWRPKIRKFVHRLVAENFVPGYFQGAVVDHIDRNPNNNKATNLRWVTQKQNYHNADNSERAKNISEGLIKAWQDPSKYQIQKTIGPWNKK